jgi:hypothetical protein
MSVRDPRDPGRPGSIRDAAADDATSRATRPIDRPSQPTRPRPVASTAPHRHEARPRASKPDATPARLAIGMVGAAATTAIVAAIVGGASAGATAVAAPAAAAPSATPAPQAAVPVRHVTQYVTIPSDATPPPRKVVYATPVPAPPQKVQQQVVVVTTTQSGRVIP